MDLSIGGQQLMSEVNTAASSQNSSSEEEQYNWDSDPGDLSFVDNQSASEPIQSNLEQAPSGQQNRTDSTAD